MSDAVTHDAMAAALRDATDAGLRFLAPFMPFLAEELFQRLHLSSQAKAHDVLDSVCVAGFPTRENLQSWNDPRSVRCMDVAFTVARTIRAAPLRQLSPKVASCELVV